MAKELGKKELKNKKTKNKDTKKGFGKELKSELKKVTWQSPSELAKSTLAVLVIILIIGVIVFCLDVVFESMNKYGLDKIKESVQTTESVENETEENVDGNVEENTDDANVENTETQEVSENATDVQENVQE